MDSMGRDQLRWVVQSNLTSQGDLAGMREACEELGIRYEEVKVIPFSNDLPDFEIQACTIYYGSTTFTGLVYNDPRTKPGIFFDEESFSMENYMAKWGSYMLNYDSTVTTFRGLMQEGHAPDKLFFIRPDADTKAFAGEVKRFDEIREWYKSFSKVAGIDFSEDSPIIVGPPYNLKFEWRLWIVDKRVVAASRYRVYFQLNKQRGCPKEVIEFAEARCREYTPHDIFVMDICASGDEYYIVECGCMNGAGFYDADISAIVEGVSTYFRKTYCN
jgi:hypothetical protein